MSAKEPADIAQPDASVAIDAHHIPTSEELPKMDVEAIHASVDRISPTDDPDQYAALHLIRGAALRSRPTGTTSVQKAVICKQIIASFEAALEIYCQQIQQQALTSERRLHVPAGRSSHWMTLQGAERGVDSRQICLTAPVDPHANAERDHADRLENEGIALVVEATTARLTANMELLERAARMFREICTPRCRERDFRQWVVNQSNLGCTVALIGKAQGGMQGAIRLEEAVDVFGLLLKEPAIREMNSEFASVHVNLADTLEALAEIAMPDARVKYLESAIDSLAAALGAVAPQRYRHLLQPSPAACT